MPSEAMTRRFRKPSWLTLCVLGILLAACSNNHTITIKSDPPGAKVTDLKQGYLGETDFEYVASDKYSTSGKSRESLNLTFSKPGYLEEKRDILNIKHSQTILVSLHSAPTYLYIETIPPGAEMKLHDKQGGELNFEDTSKLSRQAYFANRRYEIPDSTRTLWVELEQKGYKPVTREIKIEPHKENRFSFQLNEIIATLQVNSMPSGAEVYERTLGFLGRTPLKLDFKWDKLVRLSQDYDALETSSVNLQLTVKKNNYQEKSLIQEFYLYKRNPVTLIELEER
ncbi:hypothetical protein ACFOEK_16885 [Litoribrevibacter euphylliae]|uniref:PEGA domain-containing protein n=1 Tax=Litoribrevibacter euphylliae TaxID=1834034 RepID=A0ABV7HFQ9_9GAMM